MQTDSEFRLLLISVLPVQVSETIKAGHKPSADTAGRTHSLPMNGGLCNLDPLLERRVLTGGGAGGSLPGPLCFPEAAVTDVLTVGTWALSCNTRQSLRKRKEPTGLALKTQGYAPQRAERGGWEKPGVRRAALEVRRAEKLWAALRHSLKLFSVR